MFSCGDKFGDFHKNVGDFFVWTSGHTEKNRSYIITLKGNDFYFFYVHLP